MRLPTFDPLWPESWQLSYGFDRIELSSDTPRAGYAVAYKRRHQVALESVKKFVPANGRILDVAGAQGNFSLALAEAGYQVTWNDIRADLVEYVQAKHEHGSIRYLPGNLFEVGNEDSFDAALMTEVIEHVAHPDRFLARVAELVRPGGVIVMTTPNGRYWRNTLPRFTDCPDPSQFESAQFRPDADGHIFLLHPDEVVALAEAAGLGMVRLSLFTNSLTNGHVKLGLALRLLPPGIVRRIELLTTSSSPRWLNQRINVQMVAVFQRP